MLNLCEEPRASSPAKEPGPDASLASAAPASPASQLSHSDSASSVTTDLIPKPKDYSSPLSTVQNRGSFKPVGSSTSSLAELRPAASTEAAVSPADIEALKSELSNSQEAAPGEDGEASSVKASDDVFTRVRTLRRQNQQYSPLNQQVIAMQMKEIQKLRAEEGKARRLVQQRHEQDLSKMDTAHAKERESLLKQQAADLQHLLAECTYESEALVKSEAAAEKKAAKAWKAHEKAQLAAHATETKRLAEQRVQSAKAELSREQRDLKKQVVKETKQQAQQDAEIRRQQLERALEASRVTSELDLKQELLKERHHLEIDMLQDVGPLPSFQSSGWCCLNGCRTIEPFVSFSLLFYLVGIGLATEAV